MPLGDPPRNLGWQVDVTPQPITVATTGTTYVNLPLYGQEPPAPKEPVELAPVEWLRGQVAEVRELGRAA